MKQVIITSLFLLLNFSAVFSQDMSEDSKKAVINFINCVKNKDKEKLAEKISFPLRRENPIPEIKNKQEFLKRYSEVFDDNLTQMIVNSKPSEDWSEMGWQGIMLKDGEIWLDDNGSLTRVNYQSAIERKMKAKLVAGEKSGLHPSIKTFKGPVCILETKKYRIRIDDMGDGNYRYASWLLSAKMSDKPDMIIEKGEFIADGSGGNHTYEFKNDGYVYDCHIIVMGERSSPPALLTISKGDKEILSQKAIIVRQ